MTKIIIDKKLKPLSDKMTKGILRNPNKDLPFFYYYI